MRHVVAKLAEVPAGTGKAFEVGGKRLAVFNAAGRLFAIDDACPHDGAPLAEGTVEGTTLTCPWHGAEFDLTCGKVLCLPATEDVRCYPAFVSGDAIEVEL